MEGEFKTTLGRCKCRSRYTRISMASEAKTCIIRLKLYIDGDKHRGKKKRKRKKGRVS